MNHKPWMWHYIPSKGGITYNIKSLITTCNYTHAHSIYSHMIVFANKTRSFVKFNPRSNKFEVDRNLLFFVLHLPLLLIIIIIISFSAKDLRNICRTSVLALNTISTTCILPLSYFPGCRPIFGQLFSVIVLN